MARTWKFETFTSDVKGGPVALTEPTDFTHPDFALKLKATDTDAGGALLYYSTDRGHHWHGPFKFHDARLEGHSGAHRLHRQ